MGHLTVDKFSRTTEDNVDEKSEMDRSAAGSDGDWPCVTGPVASLACDVRSYQGSFHYRNGDAMGAENYRTDLLELMQREKAPAEEQKARLPNQQLTGALR